MKEILFTILIILSILFGIFLMVSGSKLSRDGEAMMREGRELSSLAQRIQENSNGF